jgi:Fur family iron response transcriptional regulator
MMNAVDTLNRFGIPATPQRIAVAEFVLNTDSHPTADQVWAKMRERGRALSRATVYNTLNLFVKKGLIKPQPLREGIVVFDGNVGPHHHFIDEKTGRIHDVPWEALSVTGEKSLQDFEVHEYQVVLRGRKRS